MAQSTWRVEVLLAGSWRGATSVLLSRGDMHIVVDTGMAHEAPLLLNALEKKGLTPANIHAVVNTHFHVDHVLNNSLFPSSVIFAAQESYEWCCSLYSDLRDSVQWEKLVLKYYPETFEYERAKTLMATLRKFALRWWDTQRLGNASQFRWLEKHVLPEGLEIFFTSGHVPGHLSIIVPTPGQATVIAGDALLSRDDGARVLTMIPHNREQFHRDREKILSMTARLLPGHGEEFSTSQ